jgi:hypothetical protein
MGRLLVRRYGMFELILSTLGAAATTPPSA